MIDNHGKQQIRKSEDFEYYKDKSKFVGSVLKNRIPKNCETILIRSEKTKVYLSFELYFTDKNSFWFRSSNPDLVLEIKRDNILS